MSASLSSSAMADPRHQPPCGGRPHRLALLAVAWVSATGSHTCELPYWRLPIGGRMESKDSPALQRLLERRLNRRRLLGSGAELAALGVVARSAYAQTGVTAGLTFPRVAPSSADAVIV